MIEQFMRVTEVAKVNATIRNMEKINPRIAQKMRDDLKLSEPSPVTPTTSDTD